ncbi:MAG: hypothetical protein A4E53_03534 [Pelotomaculum sp. PtaB.Bin104]|nr:MAG: hypothetical protein A4E53_03534 [Pelotomaculum sp. PtaB.Bin104]
MPLVLLCLSKKVTDSFHSDNISSSCPVWAWLCCIYELQELTFLQLLFFLYRRIIYVFNKRYKPDFCL